MGESGQSLGIALACDQSLDHPPTAQPDDIADHPIEFEVGVLQCLLKTLDMAAAFASLANTCPPDTVSPARAPASAMKPSNGTTAARVRLHLQNGADYRGYGLAELDRLLAERFPLASLQGQRADPPAAAGHDH